MSNRDSLAAIELYRNEDGTIQMQHIHWIGKPWDGSWQHNAISEDELNKIFGMLKPPEVPESCAECEYRFFPMFNPNEPFGCRLVKGKIKTFSGEEDPEKMTLEMINDDRWKCETPDWCPLNKNKSEDKPMNEYKIVTVKHPNCNTPYTFRVPEKLDLNVGDYVLCDTKTHNYPQVAQCITPSFTVSEEILKGLLNIAPTKLRPIVAHLVAVWCKEPEGNGNDRD